VASTAISIGLPFNLNWGVSVNIPGRVRKEGAGDNATQYAVTPDYFTTLGIPLQAGRLFTATDRLGTPAVTIVNARMAHLYWPGRSPLGECVKLGADTMPCTTVIGVVGNTIRQGIEDIVPQVYRPLDQMRPSETDNTISFFGYDLVVRTRRDAARLAEPVRRVMQSVGPNVPYANVHPMSDLLGRRMRQWELGAKVFTVLGLLALILAAVGLYSVMAFTIAQRRHEFGVRTALGAQAGDLVRLTLTKALSPVVAGIAAGIALGLIAAPFIEPLLFHVSAHDPEVFGGVALLLLVTAMVASLAPARRAAQVDPAAVLRSE
jgi:predicted permease